MRQMSLLKIKSLIFLINNIKSRNLSHVMKALSNYFVLSRTFPLDCPYHMLQSWRKTADFSFLDRAKHQQVQYGKSLTIFGVMKWIG